MHQAVAQMLDTAFSKVGREHAFGRDSDILCARGIDCITVAEFGDAVVGVGFKADVAVNTGSRSIAFLGFLISAA